jgi:hypothetical protein
MAPASVPSIRAPLQPSVIVPFHSWNGEVRTENYCVLLRYPSFSSHLSSTVWSVLWFGAAVLLFESWGAVLELIEQSNMNQLFPLLSFGLLFISIDLVVSTRFANHERVPIVANTVGPFNNPTETYPVSFEEVSQTLSSLSPSLVLSLSL